MTNYMLDPPEFDETPDYYCENCGEKLYFDDPLFLYDNEYLCEKCFVDKILKPETVPTLRMSLRDIATSLAKALCVDVAEAADLKPVC